MNSLVGSSPISPDRCAPTGLATYSKVSDLTSSIRSVVVVAEDGEHGLLAERHLRHERHEVGELLSGVLADQARRVRAHRVEVAQRYYVPFLQI